MSAPLHPENFHATFASPRKSPAVPKKKLEVGGESDGSWWAGGPQNPKSPAINGVDYGVPIGRELYITPIGRVNLHPSETHLFTIRPFIGAQQKSLPFITDRFLGPPAVWELIRSTLSHHKNVAKRLSSPIVGFFKLSLQI